MRIPSLLLAVPLLLAACSGGDGAESGSSSPSTGTGGSSSSVGGADTSSNTGTGGSSSNTGGAGGDGGSSSTAGGAGGSSSSAGGSSSSVGGSSSSAGGAGGMGAGGSGGGAVNPWPELVYSAGLVSPVGDVSIAVGPNDAPQISFVDYKFNDPAIRHAVAEGSGWTIEEIYGHPNANRPVNTIIDAAGTAHVHHYLCYYSQRSPAGVWTHDYTGSCSVDSDDVGFAVDSTGGVHTALEWGLPSVRYRHRPQGGTWSIETVFSAGSPDGIALSLHNDVPAIAFSDPDAFYEPTIGIKYAYPDGNGWAVVPVDLTINFGIDRLDMAHDAQGTAHICYGGFVASGDPTNGWTVTQIANQSTSADCEIVVDAAGDLHVCTITTPSQTHYHHHDGTGWTSTALSSVPFSVADHCSIAVDSQNRAWIVVDSHAQPAGIYATRIP